MARARPDASPLARLMAGILPLTTLLMVLAYLAALVIALPLNLAGVLRPEYCVIPLFAGGLMLPFVLWGEIAAA
ncbi:MAG: hypothetical protein ACTHNU_15125 [Gaiellales bacterium]